VSGIIWLASYPKSGNTWLRIFIENLFRNTSVPAKINELDVVRYNDNSPNLYERCVGHNISTLTDSQLHQYREAVQSYLGNTSETVFVKSHSALQNYEDKPLIYLEHTVGAVYLLRNPFDMVVSFSDHYRISYDDAIEAIASPSHRVNTTQQGIFQILGGWTNHYKSWFGVENFDPLFIRYEDMVRSPLKTFGRFSKFLGLPKNPERLKRAIRNSSFAEVSKQETMNGFSERSRPDQKFFRAGKVGGYRDILSQSQISQIIDAHGELLLEKGYIWKDGTPRV
jgi:hypothetical protein